MSEWHSRHLGGMFDTTWWPNLIFCRLFGCATMFSFTWCAASRHMVVKLLLVVFSLFLLPLLPDKMHDCSLCFFVFSILVFILLISYFVLIPFIEVLFFFFNLVLQLHFSYVFILFYFIFILILFRSFCVIDFVFWFFLLTFNLLGIQLCMILLFCISFFFKYRFCDYLQFIFYEFISVSYLKSRVLLVFF